MDEPPSSSRPVLGDEQISTAPHEILCPSNATGMPSIVQLVSPSTMTQLLCPRFGQVHLSPSLATGLPPTSMWLEALTTVPPWLVESPSRITFRMRSIPN